MKASLWKMMITEVVGRSEGYWRSTHLKENEQGGREGGREGDRERGRGGETRLLMC